MLLSRSTRHSPSIAAYFRRSLFSLPTLPSIPGFELKGQSYHEERIFPCVVPTFHHLQFHKTCGSYKEKELYAVVADVASYPQFIPFCTGSRIASSALVRAMQEKTEVDAELTVGFLGLNESYVSRVTCVPFKSVQVISTRSVGAMCIFRWCSCLSSSRPLRRLLHRYSKPFPQHGVSKVLPQILFQQPQQVDTRATRLVQHWFPLVWPTNSQIRFMLAFPRRFLVKFQNSWSRLLKTVVKVFTDREV